MARLEGWRQAAQAAQGNRALRAWSPQTMAGAAVPAASLAAAPAAAEVTVSASKASAADSSITHNQTAGVDEGGIVKRAGDHLVILRRGRLFTVSVAGDQLQPIAMTEAYAPGSDPRGAWYDELLVAGRTVVVVGYSYLRGGTEIGLFDLADNGELSYRATYHLRSNDYYSSRNYSSRIIGQKLVFYTPLVLHAWGPPFAQMMPALRRAVGQGAAADFERILPATRVYRTDDEFDPGQALALHTVTTCDLAGRAMSCEATAVLGPVGRVFHVAQGAVYVWTQAPRRRHGWHNTPDDSFESRSAVFRLPLDGQTPSALKTVGTPIDQFSFLEDASGHLNVLVRETGPGDAAWDARRPAGRLALLRAPLSAFGDGRSAAQREHYRRLPAPKTGLWTNRFVGDWLLWGAGEQAWAMQPSQARAASALSPSHAVERIEPMGDHAVLVGSAGQDLVFSAVRLFDAQARVEGQHRQTGVRQSESRSHAFFYRPINAETGLLGLPVVAPPSSNGGAAGASVVVLRQRQLGFTGLGRLTAQAGSPSDDRCKASCVDWYGNARPIFLGTRVLALMGYELVEGELQGQDADERIVERRRLDFGPRFKVHRQLRPTPFD
jgi:hypothetical protein